MIPADYLDRKLYLFDYGTDSYNKLLKMFDVGERKFEMRQLGFDSMSGMIQLQDRVVESIVDKDCYYPLSRAEFLESFQLDYVAGIFNESSEMVSFAVVVGSRIGSRSLAGDFDLKCEDCFTFDAVVTHPDWRGFGFQKQFIDWTVQLAEKFGIKNVLATVAPDNSNSRNNFLEKGFTVTGTKVKYSGLKRELLRLTL